MGPLLCQRLGTVVFLSHRQANNLLLKGPVLGHLERLKPRDVTPLSQVAQEKGPFWSSGVLHGLEKQKGQVEARAYRYLGTWSWRGGCGATSLCRFLQPRRLEASLGYLPEGAEPTREEELASRAVFPAPDFFSRSERQTEEAGPVRSFLGVAAETGGCL